MCKTKIYQSTYEVPTIQNVNVPWFLESIKDSQKI